MNISIIGTGYVGLVTGTCLADMGHTVHCIDINKDKIDNLNNGIIPIYEPGLDDLIIKNVKAEKLFFTTNYNVLEHADAIFSAVCTPSNEDGSADLQYVIAVAKEFAKHIKKRSVMITKSTVPVGTSETIKNTIKEELRQRGAEIEFDVVSNPEFLKEGNAVNDFMNPDRIIIGCDSDYAKMVMRSIYKKFDDDKLVFTTIPSAEMIKYAANAMLATRISFINDIANLCDKIGANVEDVAKGIGLDTRIGPKFLQAGCGYGGSCFPKDVKALIKTGEQNNVSMNVIKAAEKTNNEQKHILYSKLYKAASKVDYPIKNIAILGTTFKANTNDMREATSIVFINDLLNDDMKLGPFNKIRIYDPIALNEAKRRIGESNDKIEYCDEIDKAIIDSDAVIIVTDWKQIKDTSLNVIKRLMNGNIIVDGRNIFNRNEVESLKFIYEAIGK